MAKRTKNLLSAFIGTALEFYDFALYGFFATLISSLFFPKEDPVAALLSSYTMFAAGFLMRPIGGLVFGYLGDTYGRKRALFISIVMMLFPTCLIGLLPTYDQIGIWAPIALALCRLVQGLCTGGEFSGAAIFVIEHSNKNNRIFSGSLVTASSVVGMLLASTLGALFSLDSFPAWSWRIPFILSILISIFGIYIRKNIDETTQFISESKSTKPKFAELLNANKSALVATFGIGSFIGILYYVPFVFIGYYLKLVSPLAHSQVLLLITSGLVLYMLCIVCAGYVADRIGPQKVMLTACVLGLIFAMPAFWCLRSGEIGLMIQGELILAMIAGIFVGPANGLTASLFGVIGRCTGVSFSLSLGISLFGGLTPLILTYLIALTGNLYWPATLLGFGALIGLGAVCLSFRTSKRLLSHSSHSLSAV